MTPVKKAKSFPLQWQGLTRNDTTALKAIGISLIVLHNFFHLLPGWMIENEFSFTSQNFRSFRDQFSWNLYTGAGLLFAYLGHYGVQLFVFLSAYGLYASYQHKPLVYGRFLRERLWKLWPSFFLAALFFLVYTFITTKTLNHPDLYVGLLFRLSFVSNLLPGQSLSVVGPWWFYSMIVQFYLLFPLLRKWLNRYGVLPLVVISIVCLALVNLFLYRFRSVGISPVSLVIGHLSVFCLGMVLAKHKNLPMPLWVLLSALGVLLLSNWNMKAWLFSQVSVTLVFLYFYVLLKQTIPSVSPRIKQALFFVGHLSMYLFAVNGFLRAPFLQLTEQQNSVWAKGLVLFAYLLFVTLVALLLRLAEKKFLFLLSKKRSSTPMATDPARTNQLVNEAD